MSAKSAIESLFKDPFQNVKEVAEEHGVSYGWLRNKMSQEGIIMSDLKEDWINQAREYLENTDFDFIPKKEVNTMKIKSFRDLKMFISEIRYDRGLNYNNEVHDEALGLWQKWFESSEDAEMYFKECDELVVGFEEEEFKAEWE